MTRKSDFEYKVDRVMDALGAMFYEQFRGTPQSMILMGIDEIQTSIDAMKAEMEGDKSESD